MKRLECIGWSIVAALCLTGCVATAGQIREAAAEIRTEGNARMTTFADQLDRIADDVDAKTAALEHGAVTVTEALTGGTGLVAGGMALLNLMRNKSREKDPRVSNTYKVEKA